MDRYEKALEPWTSGRNIDWEIQIQDCDVRTPSCHHPGPIRAFSHTSTARSLEHEQLEPTSSRF